MYLHQHIRKVGVAKRQGFSALVCHAMACLLFPIANTLGVQAYTSIFGAPKSRGVAIGLAVQLIFAAFVMTNALIAITKNLKAKIVLVSALVLANLLYLLPQHPLRAVFFAGLSGGLSLLAIYAAMHFGSEAKSA